MSVSYSPAPQVEAVARDIIRDHHPHLIANAVKVLYLFTDKAEKVKGKMTLGTARKVAGLPAYLAQMEEHDPPNDFFLICVWQTWWDGKRTTDDQRRALVDHELCHCFSEEERNPRTLDRTGKVKLSILPHDLTEFNAVAARHGAWQPDIKQFLAALRGDLEGEERQPRLFNPDQIDVPGEFEVPGERDENGQPVSITITHAGKSVTLSPEQLRETRDRLHRQASERQEVVHEHL